jgi:hypothetical protein
LRRDFAISSCVFDEGRCKSDWITSWDIYQKWKNIFQFKWK